MIHITLALLLATPNPGCKIPSTAEEMCNQAYELWDLAQTIDRDADLCKAKVFTLEQKLQTMTATTVVHTKIVEVPVKLTPLEEAFQYVGAGLMVLGGFGLGWVVFH